MVTNGTARGVVSQFVLDLTCTHVLAVVVGVGLGRYCLWVNLAKDYKK